MTTPAVAEVTSEYVVLRIAKGEVTAANIQALEANGYRPVEPHGLVVFMKQGQVLADAPKGVPPEMVLAALAAARNGQSTGPQYIPSTHVLDMPPSSALPEAS